MSVVQKLRPYKQGQPSELGDNDTYYINELGRIESSLTTINNVLKQLDVTATLLKNAANDAAAAAAGVPLNGLYHNAGAVRVRLV